VRFLEVRVANRRSVISKFMIGLALGACVVSARPAAAQSTIFNIPSTDTVAPKKVYFEFDYLMQLPKPDEGQFQTLAPRVVIGVTPQLEVGANYFITRYADDGGSYKTFQPNAKYKFFSNDDQGLAAAAGFIGYVASDDNDSFGQIYGEVSKKFKSGARVHGGLFTSVSYGNDNVQGAILGYEQPITSKASFVVDMLTGDNFWGYLTPGVSIVLPHSGLLNIGYSIGYNELKGDGDPDNRNNALFVYYGLILY
jgi:hypothetical protein